MKDNVVDFENAGLSVSSNKGCLIKVEDGIMESFCLSGNPEWIAITAGEAVLFFEEISSSQIVKDDFNHNGN